MRKVISICILLLMAACTKTVYVPVTEEVKTDIRWIDSLLYGFLDTVGQSKKVITPLEDSTGTGKASVKDTISRLENDYAVSDAAIVAGELIHSLNAKRGEIPINVSLPEITITRLIPTPYPVETIVEIEKPLSWWKTLFLYSGVGLWVIIIGYLLIWVIKRIKK